MVPGRKEPIDVELQRSEGRHAVCYQMRVENRQQAVEVERIAPGQGWLRIHGRVARFSVQRRDGEIVVWLEGRWYALSLVERSARRARGKVAGAIADRITAPMPGTILRVLIRAGERFTAHQPLIIMESMKMETTLTVPHAGRIVEIACAPGKLVEMGAVLARIEEVDDDGQAS